MKPSRSHAWRSVVRLIGPFLLIAVLWQLDDRHTVWTSIADASWGLLAAAVVLNGPVIHLKVVRWRRLLATCGYDYPLRRCYAAVLTSLFLGMLTPGRVGDALRIQYAHRERGTPYSEGLATMLVDRFGDLYVVGAVAALGAVYFADFLPDQLFLVTFLAVGLALIAPLALVVRGPIDLFGRLLRRFSERWHANLERLLSSLRELVRQELGFVLSITGAAFAITYLQGWLIARAIGLDLSYIDIAALLSASSLLGLLPISISGVGVRELFFALLFPALGLLAAQGVAYGLLVLLAINIATIVAGFVAWQLDPPPFDPGEPGKAHAER